LAHEADKKRVQLLLKGNERDFEEFFQEYFPKVFRFCARRISGPDLEEIAMTSIRQCFRYLESYRGEASLYTWMCQIARNELSAHFRKRARQPLVVPIEDDTHIRAELESIAADPRYEPENEMAEENSRQLILALLDHLPSNYGRVLEAKYIEGLTMREIASQLNTTPKAVESILSRARAAFKEHYSTINQNLAQTLVPFPGQKL